MIPITLTLQGFYSYQSEQVIDFEKLTNAQLFGIFGSTGSGKSSILEAITFALFGELDRLNKQDSPGYNLMNLKSNSMKIELEFRAGKEGEERFKMIREYRRNSKRFEDIKVQDRRFLVWDEDNWKPEERKIEDVIGLSYDNFRRTIIIPQGRFQEFVQLTGMHRTDMLKEIFRLEKYDLQDKAASLERKNQAKLDEKQAFLVKLQDVTQEILANIQEEIKQNEAQSSDIDKTLQQQQAELQLLTQSQALFVQIEQKKEEVLRLEEDKPFIVEKEAKLRDYKYAEREFKPLFLRKKEDESKAERNQKEIHSKEKELEKGKTDLQIIENTFKSIEKAYIDRNSLLEKAVELERVMDIVQKLQKLEEQRKREQNGKLALEKQNRLIATLQTEMEQITAEIAEKKSEIPPQEALNEVRNWWEKQESLQKEQAFCQKTLAEGQALLAKYSHEKAVILQNVGFDSMAKEEDFTLKITQYQQKEAEIGQHLQLLYRKEGLKSYAEALTEGEACPLCGSKEHPEVMTVAHFDAEVTAAKNQQNEIQKTIKKLENAFTQWKSLIKNEQETATSLAPKETALSQAEKALNQHKTQFSWQEYEGKDREFINTALKKCVALQKEIEKLQTEKLQKEQQKGDEEAKEKKFQVALNEIHNECLKLEAETQATADTLKYVRLSDYRYTQTLEIEKEAKDFREQHAGIEKLYSTTKQKMEDLKTQVHRWEGEKTSLENQKSDISLALVNLKNELLQKLLLTEYKAITDIETILSQNLNIEKEEREIQSYQVRIKSESKQLEDLMEQAKGLSFDANEFVALGESIALLEEKRSELNQEKGKLQQRQIEWEKDFEEKNRLEKEHTALELRGQDIKTIKKMLERRGFVEFVAASYLQNLCSVANVRFQKLTQGKLALETAEDGKSLQVRDFFHEGKARSIKTLSGGQTFQAALSLALALADSVQSQIQAKQNFFFIDEGFGSQDKESLKLIFDTLQSLRKENRIVGIISHVEELQQEIEAYLHIKNYENEGSVVGVSW